MHLNTKLDYYSIKDMYPAETWLPYWKRLNENRSMWYDVGLVEQGTTDETHKWVEEESKDMTTNETKKVIRQYEYRKNPLHPFYSMGFRQEEIDASIKEGEALLANAKA